MQKLISTLSILLLYVTMVSGQAAVEVPFTVEDGNGQTRILTFGLDPLATGGIDPGLEAELSPPPPTGVFDARFVSNSQATLGQGSLKDIRNADVFPYSGTYTHQIKYQTSDSPNPTPTITISWDLPAEIIAGSVIRDLFGGTFINSPFVGTGSVTINNPSTLNQLEIVVVYDNIGPVTPGPIFSVNPTSIDFGNVEPLASETRTLTVTNTGDELLTLDDAMLSNPEYEVVPNPYTEFPIEINPMESYNFDVTFTPIDPGISSDDLIFEHDGLNGPMTYIPLTGNGQAQGGDLVFDPQTRTIFDNYQGYVSSVRLENYVGTDLKALQFKIVLDGALLFRSIERGTAIANGANWTFSYEIAPGSPNADGSRNDTIKVVILGNGTNQLPAGDHEIVVIEYDAVNIQINQTTTTVHFEDVMGGTGTPNPGGDAEITAGPAQQITINNRVFYGDVNLDDRVDILDILLMIDYILGRVTFTTEQFTRGDISPWLSGPVPAPDGVINALDLALLQNIVLTGEYPSGEPAQAPAVLLNIANGLQKLNPGDEAALTFHITEQGIAVVLESIVKVKGLQVNFSEVSNSTSGMQVETVMGNGYYYQDQEIVRVLVYDEQAASLEPGQYLYLNMPFSISNPRDIKIDYIVLADEENNAINKISIQVIYGNAPQLPTEYSLSQNYPNPFNPTTAIEFSIPKTSDVVISIYDMLGQEVRTLYTGEVQRGTYSVQWDGLNSSGSKMSSGSYIYRMVAGDFVQSKKMILMK
jgi:hypothetical protein